MMNHRSAQQKIVLLLTLALTLGSTFGCQGLLLTAMYFWKGTDLPPDYAGLKEKKIVVVCRPVASLQYRNANVHRELAQKISMLLQDRVPKIKVVEQRKVSKWTDENSWEDFSDVGKAMKAEMVVGIDLESFSIYQGQTLYQGTANATVRVYDCTQKSKLVFEKTIPQCVYPPSGGIATSERLEAVFRQEFVGVLADQLARHFYAHDPHADLAQDASALR